MWRTWLFVLICVQSYALHVVSSVPFGTSSLKISFSQNIEKLDFTPKKIANNAVYIDVKAVLDRGKRTYNFPRNTQVTIAQNTPQITRIVMRYDNNTTYTIRLVQQHLYISFIDKVPDSKSPTKTESKPTKPPSKQATSTKPPSKPATPTKPPAKPTASKPQATSQKQKDLLAIPPSVRPKKGYKVVIDAGHGGKDCGALGVTKICEKHIVLKVALHLHKELQRRGYIAYLTRDKDVYLNLKERTDFANAKGADLFVSIHANSVPKTSKKSPKGIETYFLSIARSDRARDVAEQENKDDIEVMNYFFKQAFLNSLNSHRLLASNKLAIDIQYGVLKKLRQHYQGITDGGVREGPFWVLAGALMPSVLIEIGYNSSPIEAPRLNNDAYQKALAVGIADGIDGFVLKNLE